MAHDRHSADLQVNVAGTGIDRVLEKGLEIHVNLIGSVPGPL
jgi:hypothetical protein